MTYELGIRNNWERRFQPPAVIWRAYGCAWEHPPKKLTFEVTACSLARESGDGVLVGALGSSAPRQSEVATKREEIKL